MKITFKNYEIREMKGTQNLEIIKWEEDNLHCITIATLIWNVSQQQYDLCSIGTRLVEFWAEGLDWFIFEFAEYYNKLKRLNINFDKER